MGRLFPDDADEETKRRIWERFKAEREGRPLPPFKDPTSSQAVHGDAPNPSREKMIRCPYCRKEISAKATTCPYCRRTPPMQMAKGLLLLVFSIGLIYIWISWGRSEPEQTASPPQEMTAEQYLQKEEENAAWRKARDERILKRTAWSAAKDFARDRLKSPASAVFQPFDENCVAIDKINGIYEVKLYVDSQNSFGAMMRTDFIVKIHRSGDNIRLVDIEASQRE